MIEYINWNEIWREINKERAKKYTKEYWNSRSEEYVKNTYNSPYSQQFIEIIKPHKDWTVLDIGCGGGTLAIPLSYLVKEVTAIDISDKMLALLKNQVSQKNITNIVTYNIGWHDNWEEYGIKSHDVVIASRSMITTDLRWGIEKLIKYSNKKIFLTLHVGSGPFDKKIIEAVGRQVPKIPEYIYVYNMLYTMGIHANVCFTTENRYKDKIFKNIDDAYQFVAWMVENITEEERKRLYDFLKQNLVETSDGYVWSYAHVVKWAVVWWDVEKNY